jgi:hypothetical protein
MSDAERPASSPEADSSPAHHPVGNPEEDAPSQGPSLALLWGLVALALAAAIGFALLIALPFHHRR